MKHKIWKRRRDGVKQRYTVGRKLKRNYGALFKVAETKDDILFRDFETGTGIDMDRHALDTFKPIEETWETIPTKYKQGLIGVAVIDEGSHDEKMKDIYDKLDKSKSSGGYHPIQKSIRLKAKSKEFTPSQLLAHEVGHHADSINLVNLPEETLKRGIQRNRETYQPYINKGDSMKNLLAEERANLFMDRVKYKRDNERLEQKQRSVPATKSSPLKAEVQKKL